MVKSDELRRRPDFLRYYGMAVTDSGVHLFSSYGALKYVVDRYPIKQLFISDIKRGLTFLVPESVEDFMLRWKRQYNDPAWDYKNDIDKKVPPGLS